MRHRKERSQKRAEGEPVGPALPTGLHEDGPARQGWQKAPGERGGREGKSVEEEDGNRRPHVRTAERPQGENRSAAADVVTEPRSRPAGTLGAGGRESRETGTTVLGLARAGSADTGLSVPRARPAPKHCAHVGCVGGEEGTNLALEGKGNKDICLKIMMK